VLLCLMSAISACPEKGHENTRTSTETRVEEADSRNSAPRNLDISIYIDAAANYLSRNIDEEGMFIYRQPQDSARQYDDAYNVLRHVGAMYALSQYLETKGNPPAKEALRKSAQWLIQNCLTPLNGYEGVKAIWSDPEITHNVDELTAKLGGAGLGLVALVSAENLQPGIVDYEDLRSLGRFIKLMQREDGSFFSKYVPGRGGSQPESSLYYPGEAALGLIMLYELTGEVEWLEIAESSLAYLAASRAGKTPIPPDHWALIATERILGYHERIKKPRTTSADLIIHAQQICESILVEQQLAPEHLELAGAFTADGRTAPTAARLEGLQAAVEFLPEDQTALRHQIERSVDLGIAFLVKAQIAEGELKGGFPQAIRLDGNDDSSLFGSASEVRIDYVQHSLSAMIAYQQKAW